MRLTDAMARSAATRSASRDCADGEGEVREGRADEKGEVEKWEEKDG